MICKDCKTEMKMISQIVTNSVERSHMWEFTEKYLYQCPNCKNIHIE